VERQFSIMRVRSWFRRRSRKLRQKAELRDCGYRPLRAEPLEDRRLLAVLSLQDQLAVHDFDAHAAEMGSSVAVQGDYAVVGAPAAFAGDVRGGAAYVYLRNEQETSNDLSDDTWDFQAKLVAPDPADDDRFGASVAIDGGTVVVGANGDDGPGESASAGSAHVFTREAAAWSHQQRLTASPEHTLFGGSVAIRGDLLVAGAPTTGEGSGAAYLFTRDGGVWSEQQVFWASNDDSWDDYGSSVAIGADTIVVGAMGDYDEVDGTFGAAYVFTHDGSEWTQQQKLIPSAPTFDFGVSLSLGDDTMVVGAIGNASGFRSGEAYVFTRSGGVWTEQQKLVADDADEEDNFGSSVSISGDTLVVGANGDADAGQESGSAYVFARGGGTWVQQQKLTAGDADAGAGFGTAVSIDSGTLIVGAPGDDEVSMNAGAGYSFGSSAGTWHESSEKLLSPTVFGAYGAPYDRFGAVVAADGDYLVVGTPDRDGGGQENAGAVYVFARNDNGTATDLSDDRWDYEATLTTSDAGDDDRFGSAVSISGQTVVVGAPRQNDGGGDFSSGAIYVFTRDGGLWAEQQKLKASDFTVAGKFGASVSIDGGTLVVGATGDDETGVRTGAVYVFTHDGAAWSEQRKLRALDGASGDRFGNSVSIDDDTVVVGAHEKRHGGASLGAAYVFVREEDEWSQQQKLAASDADTADNFGSSVSISRDTVVVGAERAAATEGNPGAAYVFTRSDDTWSELQKLTAAEPIDNARFGGSVSIDGSKLAVGAWMNRQAGAVSAAGAAFVFQRTDDTWHEQIKLTDPVGALPIGFGGAVAVSRHTVLVGASASGDHGFQSGAAFVYGPSPGVVLPTEVDLRVEVSDLADPVTAGSGTENLTYTVTVTNEGPDDATGVVVNLSNTLPAGVTFSRSVGVGSLDFDGTAPGTWTIGDLAFGVGYTLNLQYTVSSAEEGGSSIQFQAGIAQANETLIYTDDDLDAETTVAVLPLRFYQDKLVVEGARTDGRHFGAAVAIDGDYLVVGAPSWEEVGEGRAGQADVFVRNDEGTPGDPADDTWDHQATLKASDGVAFDRFGHAVAIDGNTIVVGAPFAVSTGAAYVFVRDGSSWTQEAQLLPSDGTFDDFFGGAVGISSDTVVVGAPTDLGFFQYRGSAYVFHRSGGTWTEQQKLSAPNPGAVDWTGHAVAISGDTVALGAPTRGELNAGSALIFTRNGDAWSLQEELIGDAGFRLGLSVSLRGNTLAAGANINGSGRVYMFSRTGDEWSEQQELQSPHGTVDDEFGFSVSLEEDLLIVGAAQDDDFGADPGAAYLFRRVGGTWVDLPKLAAPDASAGDRFGSDLSVSGHTVLVGAAGASANGDGSGAAYVFELPAQVAGDRGQIDLVIRKSATVFDNPVTGEVDGLPGSEPWIDEWTEFWAEIWVTTDGSAHWGIAAAAVDLTYNTDYFTATAIEYGPAFTEQAPAAIDDDSGSVSGLAATSSLLGVGDDLPVLLARVRFEPLDQDPGVPHDTNGDYLEAAGDVGLNLESPSITFFESAPIVADSGPLPATELWAMLYDADDDRRAGFGEFAFFAAAFLKHVGEFADAYAFDYDRSGRVDFADLSFVAANFLLRPADAADAIYPGGWPGGVQNLLRVVPADTPARAAMPLTEDQLAVVADEVVARIETGETLGATPHASVDLGSVRLEIADLPDDELGRVVGDNVVQIDIDAAGYGWFVDATPWDDSEFVPSRGRHELTAAVDGAAARRVDLLTAVMHEWGHLLGSPHEENGLMRQTLPLGTRRLWDDAHLQADDEIGFESDAEAGELGPNAIDRIFSVADSLS
jgi:uncharacterized repeat protein (TIGR01451 family)